MFASFKRKLHKEEIKVRRHSRLDVYHVQHPLLIPIFLAVNHRKVEVKVRHNNFIGSFQLYPSYRREPPCEYTL
jgi:hypothetical protein